jgi:hypothetical protein
MMRRGACFDEKQAIDIGKAWWDAAAADGFPGVDGL